MRSIRRRVAVVGVLAVLGSSSTGVASAYLSGGGAGSGTAGTGTAAAVTVSPSTPASGLYPGGQSAMTVSIANPNQGPVRVASLALDTTQGTAGFAVDAGHAACGLSTLAFTAQSNGGAGWTVPGGGTLAVSLPGAVSMTLAAANACQGASFTVFLRAGP